MSPSHKALILDVHLMSLEEKLTALAFQGLANRTGPNVFYKSAFWNWPEADEFWPRTLAERKGFAFEEVGSLPELIERLPGVAKGLVIWDPCVEKTKWIACVYAGLDDLLPVAPECAARYGDLPTAHDLRGKFEGEVEAYDWSIGELLPRCNRTLAYSVEKTWSGWTVDSLDYAVGEKAFVYRLDREGKNSEAEVQLAHKMMSQIGPLARILGWGEPEDKYCELVSFHDNFVFCAEAPNLSFFAKVPSDGRKWKQPARRDPATFKLEKKHYIAFCMSEGDTPKMAVSMQGGAWFDKNRGKVPVNWGCQPLNMKYFPCVMEYYFDTATDQDYFMGGASGAGYVYPNQCPNPDAYFRHTGEMFRMGDLSETDSWMHFSRPVYERYAELSGLRGIAMPCGPYGVTKLCGGKAVALFRGNSGLNYFSQFSAEALAEQIRKHTGTRAKPSFSVAHLVPDKDNPTAQGGFSPGDFIKVREMLGGDDYKIVTMQELTELAIRALGEGKVRDCQDPDYSESGDYSKE